MCPAPVSISADWRRCKDAHTAAVQMTELNRGFCPRAAEPWREHLWELATAFKSNYGIEFDPKQPITERKEALEA